MCVVHRVCGAVSPCWIPSCLVVLLRVPLDHRFFLRVVVFVCVSLLSVHVSCGQVCITASGLGRVTPSPAGLRTPRRVGIGRLVRLPQRLRGGEGLGYGVVCIRGSYSVGMVVCM